MKDESRSKSRSKSESRVRRLREAIVRRREGRLLQVERRREIRRRHEQQRKSEEITVHVVLPSGKDVNLSLHPSAYGWQLREEAANALGVNWSGAKLISQSGRIKRGLTLESNGIADGSTLTLVASLAADAPHRREASTSRSSAYPSFPQR